MTPLAPSSPAAPAFGRRTAKLPPATDRNRALLYAALCLGGAFWLASYLPYKFFGNARQMGFAIFAVGFAVFFPECFLVLMGGSITHSEVLLEATHLPYSGASFVMNTLMVLAGAAAFLTYRGTIRPRWPGLTPPLIFLVVLTGWIGIYTIAGYTWVDKHAILTNFVISALFSGGWLWYLAATQWRSPFELGARVLWAVLLVNTLGLLARMLLTTGSPLALVNPSSPFWSINPATGRLTLPNINENSFAVELLGPPMIAALALAFGPRRRVLARVALGLTAGLLLVFILQTGARQAVVGALVAAAVFLLTSRRRHAGGAVAGLGVVLVVGYLVLALLLPRFAIASTGFARIADLLDPSTILASDQSAVNREFFVQSDIDNFLDNPLLGQGLGVGSVNNLDSTAVSHNLLTSIAAEMGLFPLLVTVFFLLSTARAVLVLRQTDALSDSARLTVQGLAALCAFHFTTLMFSGRTEGGYWFFPTAVILYCMARAVPRLDDLGVSQSVEPSAPAPVSNALAPA